MKTNDPNVIVTIRDMGVAQDVSKAMASAIGSPVVIARTEGRGIFCLRPLRNNLSPAELKSLSQVAHGLREWFKMKRGLINLSVDNGGVQNGPSRRGRSVQPVPAQNSGGVFHRQTPRRDQDRRSAR